MKERKYQYLDEENLETEEEVDDKRVAQPDADPMFHYLKEIGQSELLTKDQELGLAIRIVRGNWALARLGREFLDSGSTFSGQFSLDADDMPLKEIRSVIDPATQKKQEVALIPQDGLDLLEELGVINTDADEDQLKEWVAQGRWARGELIDRNLRLVVSVAKKYIAPDMPLADLVQEGNLGLMKAADKFEFQKGYRFSTYATWWIRQSATRGKIEQAPSIRLPVHVQEDMYKYRKLENILFQELGDMPTVEDMVGAWHRRYGKGASEDKSRKKVEKLFKLSVLQPVSFELPLGEDGGGTVGDMIASEDSDSENAYIVSELSEAIAEALSWIEKVYDTRDREILEMRYGLGSYEQDHTLEEVGKAFGVTRERIRQIEARALRLLRQPRGEGHGIKKRLLDIHK